MKETDTTLPVGSEQTAVGALQNKETPTSGPRDLTFSHLQTLRAMMVELPAAVREDQREGGPGEPSFKDLAKALGVAQSTVSHRIREIEASVGSYVVPHIDAAAPSIKRRKSISMDLRESRGLGASDPGGKDKSQLVPALTLDGEIWSTFADMVLTLHALTVRATVLLKLPEVPEGRQIKFKGLRPPAPQQGPSEGARRSYLKWLQHQHKQIAEANSFLDQNRYATPGDLVRLLPDFQPRPNDQVLYDEDDFHQDSHEI